MYVFVILIEKIQIVTIKLKANDSDGVREIFKCLL